MSLFFHLLMAESHKPSDTLALTVCSYNCRGFNSSKKSYISRLLDSTNIDILLLQEHWLSESQLNVLNEVNSNYLCSSSSSSLFDIFAVVRLNRFIQ